LVRTSNDIITTWLDTLPSIPAVITTRNGLAW